MGTRCLVRVFDGGTEILCLYRQFDGYPDGMGADLQRFLAGGGPLVNGIGGDGPCFNGAGDLAAQLVFALKQSDKDPSKPTIGNVYIHAPGTSDVGEEYIYHIHVPALHTSGTRKQNDAPKLECFEPDYTKDFKRTGALKKVRLPRARKAAS